PLARRAVDLDDWSEDAHHHLVRALAALGHRAEALAAYRAYETVMVRELDLLPSPRLRTLAEGLA
ncbi:bacterial transcriptional activator domain-containing protein, partial [bacterium]|nr:bacterial transcriptional activator domain-containing protein [bacterium]